MLSRKAVKKCGKQGKINTKRILNPKSAASYRNTPENFKYCWHAIKKSGEKCAEAQKALSECVSYTFEANTPVQDHNPDNTDKGCASIRTVKNVYLHTLDVYPINLQEAIQIIQTKGAHTCVRATDVDSTHPNQIR